MSLTRAIGCLLCTTGVDYTRRPLIPDNRRSEMETYLTTEQLASRIHYDARTIRTRLKDAVLLEGVHYFRVLHNC